jgi:hypothetical protein
VTAAELKEARERFAYAKQQWEEIRKASNKDRRYVNVLGEQWDPVVRSNRENSDLPRPALEFNELHTYVQQITNRARKERPQPKVNPGDGGNPEVAELLEEKLRHIQYASQADVAYDTAVEASSSGGYGYYRIQPEYCGGSESFTQEPRVKRILDPNTVYFDPDFQEPDASDAEYCFVFSKRKRKGFKKKYGVEPSSWDEGDEELKSWGNDEQNVVVAEYWRVVIKLRTLWQLADGTKAYEDELPKGSKVEVIAERIVQERTVLMDLIDGKSSLTDKAKEDNKHPGEWIPIIPVLGREVIVDGKRHLISAVRFALDAQKLKNACGTGIATSLGTANESPYLGFAGMFKHPSWRDMGPTPLYREVEKYDAQGQVNPLPTRQAWEPPIQALSQAFLQYTDSLKRAVGYVDNVIQPSQDKLSGVAINRRNQQTELTNYHFEDNLVRSQWHAGRVMLDMLIRLTDTPRVWKVMKVDGTVASKPVTMGQQAMKLPGYEDQPHFNIDDGEYDVVVTTGKSYDTKVEEEGEFLEAVLTADPQMWSLYADLVFKLKGYRDLEERAKIALPPQIQQAIAAQEKNIPPAAAAMVTALQAQLQQLQQALQQLILERQAKLIEAQAKIRTAEIDSMTKIQVAEMNAEGKRIDAAADVTMAEARHKHEGIQSLLDADMRFMEHLTKLIHESELAPGPDLGNLGIHPSMAPTKPVNGAA